MAEYVEQSLEDLVPCLEQLRSTQLLSKKETSELVKRCRRYDYRLQKLSKRPEDFLVYVDYLENLLELIKVRRRAIRYQGKKTKIDHQIKNKVQAVFSRLCHRFQGSLEYWNRYLDFACKHGMKLTASKVFVRAIQMHPHAIPLRVRAAMWELQKNGSVENARRTLQMALRCHPKEILLWETLFKVELEFVKRLTLRIRLLKGSKKDCESDEEMEGKSQEIDNFIEYHGNSDAVTQLLLADVIIEEVEQQFREEPLKLKEVLLAFWRCSRSYKELTERLTTVLEEKLQTKGEEMKCRLEIIKRTEAGENIVDILDEKAENLSLELRRFFISLLDQIPDDAIAKLRLHQQLEWLFKKKKATKEELQRLISESSVAENGELIAHETLIHYLEAYPGNNLIWREVLSYEMQRLSCDVPMSEKKAFAKRIWKAIAQVREEDSLPIYKLYIDFALSHLPETVEKAFNEVILNAIGYTRGELKAIRAEYLLSLVDEKQMSIDRALDAIAELFHSMPNTESSYMRVYEKLINVTPMPGDFIDRFTLLGVNELAHSSVQMWLTRAEFLMQHRRTGVSSVYQRALVSLPPDLVQSFIEEFTLIQQSSAASHRV